MDWTSRVARLPMLLVVVVVGLAGCSANDDDSGPPDWQEATLDLGVDFESPIPDISGLVWGSASGEVDFTMGGGVALVDVTGDDHLDLILTAPYGDNALYVGDGTGQLVRQVDSGLEAGELTIGVSVADLNGDGLRDVLLMGADGLRVLRNVGGAQFVEEAAVELDPVARAAGAAIADADGDGDLDVYLCTVAKIQTPPRQSIDRVFDTEGGFAFVDVSDGFASEADRLGQCFIASWVDLEMDGELELHIANDWLAPPDANRLLVTSPEGPHEYVDIASSVGLGQADLEVKSMGAALGDLDGDGRLEVAVSDVESTLHLLSDTGSGFVQVGAAWGATVSEDAHDASWAVQMADVDNDGDLDLLAAWGYRHPSNPDDPWDVGQENTLWRWNGTSLDPPEELPCPTGYAWRTVMSGDLDEDGRLDLVLHSAWGPTCVLLGTGQVGHWLEVAVRGPAGNRDALGARVEIDVGGRTQVRWIDCGGSGAHSSGEPTAWFGLGDSEVVDEVRVFWPGGATATLQQVTGDQRLLVEP